MLRWLSWLLLLMALAGLAAWVADQPGLLRLTWFGFEVTAPAALLALLLAVAAIGLMTVAWIVAWAFALPMRRRLQRAARGQAAFAAGMIAIAAGEPARAEKLARKARGLLDDPTLARLLDAHAAQLQGNAETTRRAFAALAADPSTAFLGLRGLLADATARGDRDAALPLARRASLLRPTSPVAAEAELRLLLEAGDWAAARERLTEATRRKAISSADQSRLAALLDLAAAESAARLGHGAEAWKLAQKAARSLPGHAGLAAILVRAADTPAHRQQAQDHLRRVWASAPSAAVARLWQQLELAFGRDAALRAQRVRLLTDGAPNAPASLLLLAEAALDARDFVLARQLLAQEAGTGGWHALLQARLAEDGDGDATEADRWRRRAGLTADLWRCDQCGAGHAEWSIHCSSCQGFDRMSPTEAANTRMAPPSAPQGLLSGPGMR